MEREKVEHATIVVERHFKASPEKVFAAYQDPKAHDRWNVPGDDWKLAEFHHDFRPGGETISRFGPEGAPHIYSEGHYLDIVPNRRIISAGTMFDRDSAIHDDDDGGTTPGRHGHAPASHRPISLL
jgi:uncharacterized protein YndB with AHSA1/START domain